MKTLDRYVLRAWIGSFLAAGLALVGLFLLADFLIKADDFLQVEGASKFLFPFRYYAVRLPMYLVWIAPMISLCAMMLTLSRFARANEIVPVLVSGRSTRRFLMPAFAGSVLVSILMFFVDESLSPAMAGEFRESERILKPDRYTERVLITDRLNQDWVAERFHAGDNKLEKVLVVRIRPDFTREWDISAEEAFWQKGGWLLKKGVKTEYDLEGKQRTDRKRIPPEGMLVESDLRPTDVQVTDAALRMATLKELERNMRDFPHQPFWKVQWQSKWAMPVSNIVLLLIGVPLLMRSGVRNVFVGVGISLGIGVLFFGCILAFLDAGNQGRIDAVTAAWFPIVLFGSIGIAMVDAIRT